MLKTLTLALLLAASTVASAADYTVTTDARLAEGVQYGFSDTVTFTPTVSGVYSVDVVLSTIYAGCGTRYCHSKWSIVTTLSAAYIGDVNLLPLGNATLAMTAGVPYVLHLSGVGTGTGIYAGHGAYSVGVVKL